MLIPSIDLQGGQIVQLVQGEKLAVATGDVDGWVRRFGRFPKIQLIDLDAAKNEGDNSALVASICRRLPCRVGGGVRSADRAAALLDGGAQKVIVGSSLFRNGEPNLEFAEALTKRLGADRLIAAVDAREGHVVIDGWRTRLPITPVDAIRALELFFGEFLFRRTSTGSRASASTPSPGWRSIRGSCRSFRLKLDLPPKAGPSA